jgi:hypothetical protein
MGQIIAFKTRAKTSPKPVGPDAGGAQILFFLGVRYSRMEDDRDIAATRSPDLDTGQGGGRKRRKRARA